MFISWDCNFLNLVLPDRQQTPAWPFKSKISSIISFIKLKNWCLHIISFIS